MMNSIIEQASTSAVEIDFVINTIALVGGFWLLAAEFVLFYFIFRFRRSRNPRAQYVTGESKEQMRWIHWPHYAVLVCDVVIIAAAINAWVNIKQTMPPAEENVRVISQQWAWTFVHPGKDGKLDSPEDITTVNELHVKVNKLYHFKLESLDVLHSFSVPVFRLKQDAVPGREIQGWFKPTKEGVYDIQCAEICGIGHGAMVAHLHVHSEADYDKWAAEQRAHSYAMAVGQ